MGRIGKRYSSKKRKGPPDVKAWWSYNLNNGGSPVVIRRKRGYLQTRLKDLTHWERALEQEQAKDPSDRHDDSLKNLRRFVDNKKAWVNYSAQVLRNCVRFAIARIEHDSEDYAELIRRRAEAGRPIKNKVGRNNKPYHSELRYYAATLDEYILAKEAIAGNSRSADAMTKVWEMCAKAVSLYKRLSLDREADDAEQQAALGILHACKLYEPSAEKMAKLSTYASFWIRRKIEARTSAECKPGLARVNNRYINLKHIDIHPDSDGGRADQFHPVAEKDTTALRIDVDLALADLTVEERDIARQVMQLGWSASATAERTGTKPARVRSLLRKAKEKLAKALSAHAPE